MPISKSRKNDITNAIVHWVTKAGLPLYTVGKSGCQQTMSATECRYNIPSKKPIDRRVAEDYKSAQKNAKMYIKNQIVQQSGICSLTTDM